MSAFDGSGRRVRYHYRNGRLSGVADVLGGETVFVHDGQGGLERVVFPGGRESHVRYKFPGPLFRRRVGWDGVRGKVDYNVFRIGLRTRKGRKHGFNGGIIGGKQPGSRLGIPGRNLGLNEPGGNGGKPTLGPRLVGDFPKRGGPEPTFKGAGKLSPGKENRRPGRGISRPFHTREFQGHRGSRAGLNGAPKFIFPGEFAIWAPRKTFHIFRGLGERF